MRCSTMERLATWSRFGIPDVPEDLFPAGRNQISKVLRIFLPMNPLLSQGFKFTTC